MTTQAWRTLTYAAFGAGAVIFTNDSIATVVHVYGTSMVPTLSPTYHETGQQDWLLLDKREPGLNLARGDVVSLWAPHKPEHLAVKRIVGLEGDTVFLDRRRAPRDETHRRAWELMGAWDWTAARDETADERIAPEPKRVPSVTVPFGHVWVEGDGWRDSEDSNTYGPISKSLIQGKAVCLLWPLSRFGLRPWSENVNTTRVRPGVRVVPEEWKDCF